MRLRSAIATARLAAVWPTTQRSSSATISRGESASTPRARLAGRGDGAHPSSVSTSTASFV